MVWLLTQTLVTHANAKWYQQCNSWAMLNKLFSDESTFTVFPTGIYFLDQHHILTWPLFCTVHDHYEGLVSVIPNMN